MQIPISEHRLERERQAADVLGGIKDHLVCARAHTQREIQAACISASMMSSPYQEGV